MSLPAAFLRDAERLIPAERRFDDPTSTLAFGTDASFYRLIPKLVVRVESEDEVVGLIKLAQRERVPAARKVTGTRSRWARCSRPTTSSSDSTRTTSLGISL